MVRLPSPRPALSGPGRAKAKGGGAHAPAQSRRAGRGDEITAVTPATRPFGRREARRKGPAGQGSRRRVDSCHLCNPFLRKTQGVVEGACGAGARADELTAVASAPRPFGRRGVRRRGPEGQGSAGRRVDSCQRCNPLRPAARGAAEQGTSEHAQKHSGDAHRRHQDQDPVVPGAGVASHELAPRRVWMGSGGVPAARGRPGDAARAGEGSPARAASAGAQRASGSMRSMTISRPRATRLFTVPTLQLQIRALSS